VDSANNVLETGVLNLKDVSIATNKLKFSTLSKKLALAT
jgi:hypothetical protein